MTEDLKTLRAKLWEAIKAIDNATASGSIETIEPKVKEPKILLPSQVLKETCAFYDITEETLKDVNRQGDFVKRRIVAIKLIMEYCNVSHQGAADILGYKTRANVIHHLRNMDSVLQGKTYDHNYLRRDYNEIKKRLEA
jgi:chromosomal replication initiation ATPase DnaA